MYLEYFKANVNITFYKGQLINHLSSEMATSVKTDAATDKLAMKLLMVQ